MATASPTGDKKRKVEDVTEQKEKASSGCVVVGLTGGIASGKSTVAKLMGEFGAHVIDADKLGHAVYAPGEPALDQIKAAFGAGVANDDGTIDRKALGARVFSSKDEMKKLTDIVWPEIRKKAITSIEAAKASGAKVVVLEAAVIVEAKWYDAVDQLWTVEVPIETASKRLQSRNSLSEEEALQRIRSQISNEDRRAVADTVLSNSGDLEQLTATVKALCKEKLNLTQ